MELFYTLSSINDAVEFILPYMQGGACIALHGEMGSGKTTLVSHLVAHYSSVNVTSPTYAIVNEYPINDEIVIAHMDWYRLENAEAIIDAGILEYISNPRYISIIEWSERAPELLPEDCTHFYIQIIDDEKRFIHQ